MANGTANIRLSGGTIQDLVGDVRFADNITPDSNLNYSFLKSKNKSVLLVRSIHPKG